MPRLFTSILLSALLFSSAARPEDGGLKAVSDALVPVRATHGMNDERDAGPELTPVKHALRKWIEQGLSTLPDTTDDTVRSAQLTALAERLNGAIKTAGLACDSGSPDPKRCVENLHDDLGQDNARGYIGDVELSTVEYNRYLVIKTAMGIRCGYDESAYIYEFRDKHWRLLLQSEQNRYGEHDYQPQVFLSINASPAGVAFDEPAPPPLLLTLGFSPWCSSNWQMLYTRLWRASLSNPSPKPLIESADTLYMGDDPAVAEASVTQTDALIEFRGRSIDGGSLIRPVVRHYLVHAGDKIERIGPLALNPNDFVDEWLMSPWGDAVGWTDRSGHGGLLAAWHRKLHKDDLFGEFEGPPKRCRADPSLWQVGFAFNSDNEKDYRVGPPVRFLVRWMAPYRFSMVRVQQRNDADCAEAVDMPDNLGTLFPLQDWRP